MEKNLSNMAVNISKLIITWDNFIKLLVLMYAEDTILLADSKDNLQLALNTQL